MVFRLYKSSRAWELAVWTLEEWDTFAFSRAYEYEVSTRISHQNEGLTLGLGGQTSPKVYLKWLHRRGPVWGSWRQFSGDKHSQCKPGQPAAAPQRHGLAQNGQGVVGSSSYPGGGPCCRSCSSRYKLQETKNPGTLECAWQREVREQLSSICSTLALAPLGFPTTMQQSTVSDKEGLDNPVPSCYQPKLHHQELRTKPIRRTTQNRNQGTGLVFCFLVPYKKV